MAGIPWSNTSWLLKSGDSYSFLYLSNSIKLGDEVSLRPAMRQDRKIRPMRCKVVAKGPNDTFRVTFKENAKVTPPEFAENRIIPLHHNGCIYYFMWWGMAKDVDEIDPEYRKQK